MPRPISECARRRVLSSMHAAVLATLLCPAVVRGAGDDAPQTGTGQDVCGDASPGGTSCIAKRYSLAELIALAQGTNPSIKGAGETARQASISRDLVESSYSPQVSFNVVGGFERTPLPIPTNVAPAGYFVSNTRELIPGIGMKWLLFDFGRRKGRAEEARQTTLAAEASVAGSRQKLSFDVSQGYFSLVSAAASVRAATGIVQAAQTIEEAVVAQNRAGRATVVAVAQAQRQVAAAKLSAVRARGAERAAKAVLVSTVGLPPETDIILADETALANATVVRAPVRGLIAEALRRRQDLQAAGSQVSAANARLDAARAAYRPTISLSAQAFQNAGAVSSDGSRYSSVNRPGGAILVAFELPLVDGGMRRSNVAMANSQVAGALDQLDALKDRISAEVVRADVALATAVQQRDETDAYVSASKAAFDAALASFRRGLSTVQEVEAGSAVLAEAIAARESARADLQVAIAQLALATGAISVDATETDGAGNRPQDEPRAQHVVASDIPILQPGERP